MKSGDKKDLEIMQRMAELTQPIDRQIMMCDDSNEILMLASAMLTTSIRIFDEQITPEGRNHNLK
jgi:hypothetical protein